MSSGDSVRAVLGGFLETGLAGLGGSLRMVMPWRLSAAITVLREPILYFLAIAWGDMPPWYPVAIVSSAAG